MQEASDGQQYAFSGTVDRIVRSKFGGPDIVVARLHEHIEGCEWVVISPLLKVEGAFALRQAGLLQRGLPVRGIGVRKDSTIMATRLSPSSHTPS